MFEAVFSIGVKIFRVPIDNLYIACVPLGAGPVPQVPEQDRLDESRARLPGTGNAVDSGQHFSR